MNSVSRPQLVSSAYIFSQQQIPLWRPCQFMKLSFLVATLFFYCDKSCLLSTSQHLERCRNKILLSSFFSLFASCLLSQHPSLSPSITSCRNLDFLSQPSFVKSSLFSLTTYDKRVATYFRLLFCRPCSNIITQVVT